jgi:tRNA sulfurtransferase ThiI
MPASFRVLATRSDKRLPFTSPQVEREIGGMIWRRGGKSTCRTALTIHIEMLPTEAFYFFGKEPGAGGMPSGTGGRVACLLSGGIDSPVAAYRMMRRGCKVLLIHFHSYPILSRASQEKVREIAALLTRHQLRSRLMLVPFGELQQQVVLGVPPELRVVIYRRLMLRIAERLARKGRAGALVTGEVVGQVASQTLENMTAIAQATTLEILRPSSAWTDDHRRGGADRQLPDLDHPDQTAARCSRRSIRRRARGCRGRAGRIGAADRRHGGRPAATAEDFRFPMLESAPRAARRPRRISMTTFRP